MVRLNIKKEDTLRTIKFCVAENGADELFIVKSTYQKLSNKRKMQGLKLLLKWVSEEMDKL